MHPRLYLLSTGFSDRQILWSNVGVVKFFVPFYLLSANVLQRGPLRKSRVRLLAIIYLHKCSCYSHFWLHQMSCGLSSMRRALHVLRKARMFGRVRQGNAVDLASCTLSHPSIFVRQLHTMATMFVLLQPICVVKCVDR